MSNTGSDGDDPPNDLELPLEGGPNDRSSSGSHTYRRDFLKGSGAVATSGMLLGGPHPANGPPDGDDEVPAEPQDGGEVRHFDVHAIEVDLVYNRYGLHQPNAAMYVLERNLEAAREASGEVPCGNNLVLEESPFCEDLPEISGGDDEDGRNGGDDAGRDIITEVLQPLVLRANRGDIIEVEFHNDLSDRFASMHPMGIPYEVEPNDGMDVGFNPNTTVPPGESITYRWFAGVEGAHFFWDGANQAWDSAEEPPEEANNLSRGLFGTIKVYPQGTTWTDPIEGGPIESGLQADIHPPDDPDYREIVVHYHSPEGMVTSDGDELTWPDSDEIQEVHAINYRADPTGNRLDPQPEAQLAPDDVVDESEYFYNSWVHGDPGGGDNVYPVYVGDPVEFVTVGASVQENHAHHLHGHRWMEIPTLGAPAADLADTLDVQTVGLGAAYEQRLVAAHSEGSVRPEMTFEQAFQVGAGGPHDSAGDYLFHCHLFPHYAEGMWAIMRALDKEHEDLEVLPNNEPPIPPDADDPGYPEFIPNEIGSPPPLPPYDGIRDPEPLEAEALDNVLPGAPYTDPCDPDFDDFPEEEFEPVEGEVREYTIVAVPSPIVYNDAGDHDPEGQVYVLEEDLEDVLCGRMNPEPLVIRANVGDCVNVEFVNLLESDKSPHIHFVSYDVLGSDALATGFNYDQGVESGEALPYRWYADEEGTIFFHDHISGIEEVMHGAFAMLVVEPAGSEWLDPHTGEEIRSGTQAIIDPPDEEAFREFSLFYQDFAPLRNCDGEFVNPDDEHNENAGVMAINYRNAPFYRRDESDPAYVFSSFVFGDPPTPVLEAYEGDPIKIRLLQAAYEEQHNFGIHDRHINPVGLTAEDSTTQHFGTAEAFTFELEAEPDFERLDSPLDVPVRDHMYGSWVIDDLWDGMWGIQRSFGAEVPHLQPLPDREPPEGTITEEELKELGHPAAFDDRAEKGHKSKHCRDDDEEADRIAEFVRRRLCDDETLTDLVDRGVLDERALDLIADHDEREDDNDDVDDIIDGIVRDELLFPPDLECRQNEKIGSPPPLPPGPGDPCPPDAEVRSFDVSAVLTTIPYNEYGDQDPLGIVFVRDEYVDDVLEGRRDPEPLTLRVESGECVEINLTNRLPEDLDEIFDDHEHPLMRTNKPWDRGNRISLHPQRMEYDVQGSDGATVGFNWDQTIPPGETITYRWLAPENAREISPGVDEAGLATESPMINGLGTVVLWDMGDIRSNRHHGAYGRVIVEPEGSVSLSPRTAEPIDDGDTAMMKMPDGEDDFREFNIQFTDGQYIVNPTTDVCVVPPGEELGQEGDGDFDLPVDACNQIGDQEDQGYLGVNYRAEPFVRRFDENPNPWEVYDSEEHGDPATPVFQALLDEPVMFRVSQAADRGRGYRFHLSDHVWQRFFGVEESPLIGGDDRWTPGKSRRLVPEGGAGGLADTTGDFIYQETAQRRRLEAGAWGIFRVRDDLADFPTPVQPLPDDAGSVKLKDRPGWIVATGDVDGDGHRDVIVGVPDSARGSEGTAAAYVFFGPVNPSDITDLAEADVGVLLTVDDDEATVRVSADDRRLDPSALLQLVADTTLTVLSCDGSIDPIQEGTITSVDQVHVRADGFDSLDVTVDSADVDGGTVTVSFGDGWRVVVHGCASLIE